MTTASETGAVLTGDPRAIQVTVDYLPGHLVPGQFPATAGELSGYGAVILSDIGANSILLAPRGRDEVLRGPGPAGARHLPLLP